MVMLSRTIFVLLRFDPFAKLAVSEIFNRLSAPSVLHTDFLAGEMGKDLDATFTVPIDAADANAFRGAVDLAAVLVGGNSAKRIFFRRVHHGFPCNDANSLCRREY